VLASFESAVQLQNDAIAADFDLGHLHHVPDARRRSAGFGDFGPSLFIVSAVGVELEVLFGARNHHLGLAVFGHQAAHDFNAIVGGEFLRGAQGRHAKRRGYG
jgi:hypothetical protein